MTIDAVQIAAALGPDRPTAEQRQVIEAELAPALVIAGAGSGKTETMASRVLWLLANGHVRPDQILGLTFTRKAAGELADRIRRRIVALHGAGLMPTDYDEFDPPVVATYNSFANTIYRQNAILLGREADGAVLGEASAWQLARSIVVASRDRRLIDLDHSVDAITRAVLRLSRALAENIVNPAEVAAMAGEFARLTQLPNGGRGGYPEVDTMVSTVAALPVLLELAHDYEQLKQRRGFVEYSDQVSLALQLLRTSPSIADELRERHVVVLLDEYQDTSVVQTWLLSELFAGRAVMAVGDPHQSIYGWRGASAGNLDSYARQFGNGEVQQFALSTSWRNGCEVLAVANALVEPLTAITRVPVQRLQPGPAASARPVDVVFEETIEEEAEAAARWLGERLRAKPRTEPGEHATVTPPSAAMLFRARKNQDVFIAALRRHGIPYHVLGIGGLLAEPEIADLVCALTVVSDPGGGAELVRLLAGSRWRIGVRDLHTLSRVASWLRDRDWAQQPLNDGVRAALRSSVAEGEGSSLVDALDFVAHARDGHSVLQGFSEPGLKRLRHAGLLFARLRGRASLDLLETVTVVEQELGLDIETAANESRSQGRATMDAFFDALNGYLAVSETGGLAGFLAWLREAEWRDGLAPRAEEPEPGTVQLLTVHGSKGLEWDHVVVPRMVAGELPGKPNEGTGGWLGFGLLPYEFRGDADELPEFRWRSAETRKEVKDERAAFGDRVAEHHEREERRLAYVAVTRARHSLLLSGSFWATQTKPRSPSPFLMLLAERGHIAPLPTASAFEQNPSGRASEVMTWPPDPLGGRRPVVEAAAEAVRAASPGAEGRWRRDVELLLAERRRMLERGSVVELPRRIPASRFKDFVTEPAAVAAELLRPMPERPYRATRLGTLFHSWVEARAGVDGGVQQIDALLLERDDDGGSADNDLAAAEAERLAALQATFERSPWAGLRPIEVEREIHLPFDGRLVICKIDAVYERDGRYEIVDWKTGRPPANAEELERKQLQLALYRLAYARWRGIEPDLIDAAFYFVADDLIVRPAHVADEAELLALWRGSLSQNA
ncbi:MAG TPA: ATP-dependent DNA helicase [Humibacter sp.]|nr:ATP-dependent DNA helicase [Humibacter sp.]